MNRESQHLHSKQKTYKLTTNVCSGTVQGTREAWLASGRRSRITFTRLSPGADRAAGVVGRERARETPPAIAPFRKARHVYTDARRNACRCITSVCVPFRRLLTTYRFTFMRLTQFYCVILFESLLQP